MRRGTEADGQSVGASGKGHEELVEALAVSAAETTAVTGAEAEQEAGSSPAPVPGSTVPPWREGLPVTLPAPDYQRILGVLEERSPAGQGPLKAREIAMRLGLETTPAKVEGVRVGLTHDGCAAPYVVSELVTHATVDVPRLRRLLGAPELEWIVERARGRLVAG